MCVSVSERERERERERESGRASWFSLVIAPHGAPPDAEEHCYGETLTMVMQVEAWAGNKLYGLRRGIEGGFRVRPRQPHCYHPTII